MIKNRAELLVRIVRYAPWLIDGNDAFFPEATAKDPSLILQDFGNTRQTLICDNGHVFREKLTVAINDHRLKISKPAKWEESAETFYLFFQPQNKKCYFFQVENAINYPLFLSAKLPRTIYTLQKRRHRRVMSEGRLNAFIRNDNNIVRNFHIHNLSEGGMLISEDTGPENFPAGSLVSDIFISINTQDKDLPPRKLWPPISKGRIVRTVVDKDKSLTYYGIAFLHQSIYVKDSLSLIIEDLSSQSPNHPSASLVSP